MAIFNSYVKLPEGNISGLFDDSPFPSIHTSHLPVLDSKEQEFPVRLPRHWFAWGWGLDGHYHESLTLMIARAAGLRHLPLSCILRTTLKRPVSRQAAFADGFLNMNFKVPTAGRQARPQTRPRAVHRKERLHHTPSGARVAGLMSLADPGRYGAQERCLGETLHGPGMIGQYLQRKQLNWFAELIPKSEEFHHQRFQKLRKI